MEPTPLLEYRGRSYPSFHQDTRMKSIWTRGNYIAPEKKLDVSIYAIYACEKQYKTNVYSEGDGRFRLYKGQELEPNINVSDPNLSQVTATTSRRLNTRMWKDPCCRYSCIDYRQIRQRILSLCLRSMKRSAFRSSSKLLERRMPLLCFLR